MCTVLYWSVLVSIIWRKWKPRPRLIQHDPSPPAGEYAVRLLPRPTHIWKFPWESGGFDRIHLQSLNCCVRSMRLQSPARHPYYQDISTALLFRWGSFTVLCRSVSELVLSNSDQQHPEFLGPIHNSSQLCLVLVQVDRGTQYWRYRFCCIHINYSD